MKNSNINMLQGKIPKSILLFTLPIAMSSIIQQLFNSADTAVVGYFGSSEALAAVGTNTEIIAFIVTISSGLSIGVNILIANMVGQKRQKEIPSALQTAMLLAAALGVTGLILGQLFAKPILCLIQTPDEVLGSAAMYLRIYLLGYPFLLLYDFGSAAMRARGNSRYPFVALVISGVINVLLNLLFVIAFDLGVAGVAISTDISTFISAVIVLTRLVCDREYGLSLGKIKFSVGYVGKILAAGIPSAVQGAVFCFANIFVQASVNTFGKNAIAGSTIAVNFEYFTYYIITAFAQAATTFTSQNYAAGQLKRCKKIFFASLMLSALFSSAVIFTIVIFRGFFASLFSGEQGVIDIAAMRILCILALEPICNLYEIPTGCMRGRGYNVYPAVSTMLGTCAFRIVWIFTVFRAHRSLPVLFAAFPCSWLATLLLVTLGFVFMLKKQQYNSNQSKNVRKKQL